MNYFAVENDVFLQGNFPHLDSPDGVVDYFILSFLISLSSPCGMNCFQLTVATKSAVCFSEKENKHTF